MSPATTGLPGERYGRCLVIEEAESQSLHRRVLIRCDCGTEKVVYVIALRQGKTTSCGCYHREQAAKNMRALFTTHGHTPKGAWSPTYVTWNRMRDRCENPKNIGYKNYGGRGIALAPEWRTFANFLADMGERPEGHTLDRIDNDGDYTPENCRWATWTEQAANRRPPHPS